MVLVVDDSHGVGAFGPTGRGTEEYTGAAPVDILVGTLGKAFGVNGGYVAGSAGADRLPARDGADLHLLEPDHAGRSGRRAHRRSRSSTARRAPRLLDHLRAMTARFEQGLVRLGSRPSPASIRWCR